MWPELTKYTHIIAQSGQHSEQGGGGVDGIARVNMHALSLMIRWTHIVIIATCSRKCIRITD